MVSNRDRQRAAARARLERQMAERAEQMRRRRRLQTMLGAGAGTLVLIVGVVWLVVAVGSPGNKPKAEAKASGCIWNPAVDPSASPAQSAPPGIKDVGTPPTDVPHSGTEVMTLTTNLGVVKVEMDAAKTPCTAASFAYLASKNFFNDTKCHRLVPEISALQCGDPAGDGTGGPSYKFADENLPSGKNPPYPKGSVAMANAGANTNGSQFFFVYNDSSLSANYSLFGKVTEGLDIIEQVAAGGHDDAYAESAGGGHPNIEFVITSMTVEPVEGSSTAGSAPASASATEAPASVPAQ